MDYECVIIGGGVVGLSCAYFLSQKFSTLLIEQHSSFGQETSSRNSQVIHSGIYYPSWTLKAKLCVEGNKSLYSWCKSNNIPYRRIGKYIIATCDDELEYLEKLYKRGIENCIDGIYEVSREEILKNEPNVYAIAGLWSPSTGIIDSHKLMESLYSKASALGCDFAFYHKVVGIDNLGDYYKIYVRIVDGEIFPVTTKFVVNSAGLESDTIASLVGLDIDKYGYRLNWAKGHYFRVKFSKSNLVRHLVYPVPPADESYLGIHLTVDLDGSLKLGPDFVWMECKEQSYKFDEDLNIKFWESAKRYLPWLELDDLSPDQTGIRPKLISYKDYPDFVINEESSKGLPGFVNLIGIESPGLTCCLEIGKLVREKLSDFS
ncbi:MAG: NAD(P)/FAD-dependent oxidoreductase [Ignavibacteria bacterium]|nr:NAD(P)/FAD-dependent oxidoreductase [Ignavibacteria bacterium]